MINQKIDALKITKALISLHASDENNPRMSLLDLQIFLTINANPSSGKNHLLEMINYSMTSRSFLDRPINRLLKYKLIDRVIVGDARTKNGEARVYYSVSKPGLKFIRDCSHS